MAKYYIVCQFGFEPIAEAKIGLSETIHRNKVVHARPIVSNALRKH